MLTGDNVATAINIGISCNLLDADMESEKRLFTVPQQRLTTPLDFFVVFRSLFFVKFDKEIAPLGPQGIEQKLAEAESTLQLVAHALVANEHVLVVTDISTLT